MVLNTEFDRIWNYASTYDAISSGCWLFRVTNSWLGILKTRWDKMTLTLRLRCRWRGVDVAISGLISWSRQIIYNRQVSHWLPCKLGPDYYNYGCDKNIRPSRTHVLIIIMEKLDTTHGNTAINVFLLLILMEWNWYPLNFLNEHF